MVDGDRIIRQERCRGEVVVVDGQVPSLVAPTTTTLPSGRRTMPVPCALHTPTPTTALPPMPKVVSIVPVEVYLAIAKFSAWSRE